MAAQRRDGTTKHCLGAFAQADVAGDVAGDALVLRAPHKATGLADGRLGEKIEIRGLLKLSDEGLFKGAVKNSVASGVDKISDQNSVFLGELGGAAGGEEQAAGEDQAEQEYCGDRVHAGLKFLR